MNHETQFQLLSVICAVTIAVALIILIAIALVKLARRFSEKRKAKKKEQDIKEFERPPEPQPPVEPPYFQEYVHRKECEEEILKDLERRKCNIDGVIAMREDGRLQILMYNCDGVVSNISEPVYNIHVNEGLGGRMIRPMFELKGKRKRG